MLFYYKCFVITFNGRVFFKDMMVPTSSEPQASSHLRSGDSKNKKKRFSHIFRTHSLRNTCGTPSMLPTAEARRDPGLVFSFLYSWPRVTIGVDVFRPAQLKIFMCNLCFIAGNSVLCCLNSDFTKIKKIKSLNSLLK
jgi:hypothetical protein